MLRVAAWARPGPGVAALLALACVVSAPFAQSATLVSRFDLGADGTWTIVHVRLAQGSWRVGSIDGRLATDGEVRSALALRARLTIGARCVSAREGDLIYPCGFALSAPDLGGRRDTDPEGMLRGWRGTLAYTVRGRLDAGDDATVIAFDAPDAKALRDRKGGTSGLPRFIGFAAPQDFLGDGTDAFGRTLSFRFRPVAGAMSTGAFDRASGIVSLSGDDALPGVRSTDDEASVMVADLNGRGDRVMLAYALDGVAAAPARDGPHDVEALLGRWVKALNTRALDELGGVYHRQARLFDGQPVFSSARPEGLRRHLLRTPDLSSWRVLGYRIRTEADSGHVDVAFSHGGSPSTGPAASERGVLRLNLAREDTRWRIVSHGPWSNALLAP